MNFEEFESKMKEILTKINIELNKKQIEQFYKYMNLLIEWNNKMNLTAIVDPDEIIIKHFVDSIIISKYIKTNARIIDIGTGAGFPGVPLKIIREDIDILLLDSLNKRINFLNEVITELGLTKITAIHARVEEFARNKKYRENFEVVVSRAVANMSTLSEYMLPLTKVGENTICMKGSEFEDELENSKKAISILGGKIEKIEEYKLPETDMNRSLIILKKIKTTPQKYPRKAGTPSKEPL